MKEGSEQMQKLSRTIPYVSLAVRVFLGVMFVYAGAMKIVDPAGFARAVANYRILPGLLVNPFALVLPWVEIIAGLCLILGVAVEGGALVIGSLLAVFCIALALSLIRGLDISCGCFSTSPEARRIGWSFLVRDLVLTAMAWFVFLQDSGVFSVRHIFSPSSKSSDD